MREPPAEILSGSEGSLTIRVIREDIKVVVFFPGWSSCVQQARKEFISTAGCPILHVFFEG